VKRVDDLLLPLVKDLGIQDNIRLTEIKKIWYSLFKDPLSSHMSPYKLSEGEILLNVDSPVWLHELNYFKEDIIKTLSSYGVREVRFRLGRVSTKEKSEIHRQTSRDKTLTTEELSYIEKTTSQLSDGKLRETVKRAMKKALIGKRD
jgi:hypothetical protein